MPSDRKPDRSSIYGLLVNGRYRLTYYAPPVRDYSARYGPIYLLFTVDGDISDVPAAPNPASRQDIDEWIERLQESGCVVTMAHDLLTS